MTDGQQDFLKEVEDVFEQDGIETKPFGPEHATEILADLHAAYEYRTSKTDEVEWAAKARPKLKDAYKDAKTRIQDYEKAYKEFLVCQERMQIAAESFEQNMERLRDPSSFSPVQHLKNSFKDCRSNIWLMGVLMKKTLRMIGSNLRLEASLPLRPLTIQGPHEDISIRRSGKTKSGGATSKDPALAYCIDCLWFLGVKKVAHLQHLIEIVHRKHLSLKGYDSLNTLIAKHAEEIKFEEPELINLPDEYFPDIADPGSGSHTD